MGSLNSFTFIGWVVDLGQEEFKVRLDGAGIQIVRVGVSDWLASVAPLLKKGQLVFGEGRLEGPRTDRLPLVVVRRLLPIDNILDLSRAPLVTRAPHHVDGHIRRLPPGE